MNTIMTDATTEIDAHKHHSPDVHPNAPFVRIEHLTWCWPNDCSVDVDSDLPPDPGRDWSAHYGQLQYLSLNRSVGAPLRDCANSRELAVRPIEFQGSPGVEVSLNGYAQPDARTSSGMVGISWITAEEARDFASMLISAAERVEEH